jgi:signal transduction histidine kinase/DNA-binding response OmpR family regulator/ligand-binding sensor domain-containing protein
MDLICYPIQNLSILLVEITDIILNMSEFEHRFPFLYVILHMKIKKISNTEVLMKYLFVMLLALFPALNISGENFQQLSLSEGLSSRQAYRLCHDPQGFIWICTSMGVDRYDGNEIRHYALPQSSQSRDNIISSTTMSLDHKGNLWIAQKDGHIYQYSRRTDAFVLCIDLTCCHSKPILNNIFFSSSNQMFLCMQDGLFSWNFTTKHPDFIAFKSECVNCMAQSDDGSYSIGTNRGIYHFFRQKYSRKYTIHWMRCGNDAIVKVIYPFKNKIYIGTFNEGMFMADITSSHIISFGNFIPHKPIRCLIPLNNRTLLIGIDGAGVVEFNTETDKVTAYFTSDENNENGLCANTVSDICIDRKGDCWIATTTNGLCHTTKSSIRFSWQRHEPYNSNSLISNNVNAILQDAEGDYWYGTNNGISLYHVAAHGWSHFLNSAKHDENDAITLALCDDKRGNIWAGGYGMGVYCINKHSGAIRQIAHRNNSQSGISSDYIYAIFSEGDNIWCGGIEGEFTRYNAVSNFYTYYPITCIGDIKSLNKRFMILAGCQGMGFFEKQTGKTSWMMTFGHKPLTCPIRCLLQISPSEIWLATDGEGLIRYNPQTGASRFFTEKDGISSNSINNIVSDNYGRIWFSTEKELYYLDSKTNVVINANDLLGIKWGMFNSNAAIRTHDGTLMFGTANGALSIHPFRHLNQNNDIRLILTDFRLMYHSLSVGEKDSPLKSCIDKTDKLVLKHKQNSFSISFSAIDFEKNHKVKYAYRLSSVDKTWKMRESIGNIDYMNIPSGRYTFILRAFDKYSMKLIAERHLTIVVSRPLWLSWWAIFIYLLLFSIAAYFIYLYRLQQLREAHFDDKIRSFISFAHDIRTPLTLVKSPLDKLSEEQDMTAEGKKAVTLASRNVEKLLVMVSHLLDLQRMEVQTEAKDLSTVDMEDYLSGKIAEFRSRAIQKGLAINLVVQPSHFKVSLKEEKFDRIIDNLLSNALKYTREGYISISATRAEKRWSLEIKDTGIGIPKEDQKKIFDEYYRAKNAGSEEQSSGIGLLITRRLVMQERGKITFVSEENKGSTFTVTFPINRNVDSSDSEQEQKANSDNQQIESTTVLLAEDDDDMREYLSESLSHDYNVISVDNGAEELEVAKRDNPDIIISDIILPSIQGDEVCRILKSSTETSHIPVILLTALAEKEDIIHGLEVGANDYIVKPFDLSVLKVRIHNILENRRRMQQRFLSADVKTEEIEYSNELDKKFLEHAMSIVNEQLQNPDFSISDFCQELCMSRSSVYNKIKTLTGQGPNDFIRIVRLNKAKELIASHRYSIAEVSVMVGFSDAKYFSTSFKKQFGISPSKV